MIFLIDFVDHHMFYIMIVSLCISGYFFMDFVKVRPHNISFHSLYAGDGCANGGLRLAYIKKVTGMLGIM